MPLARDVGQHSDALEAHKGEVRLAVEVEIRAGGGERKRGNPRIRLRPGRWGNRPCCSLAGAQRVLGIFDVGGLFRDLTLARADGSLRSLLARLARIDVLPIDE